MSVHRLGRQGFAVVCDACGREQSRSKQEPEGQPEYLRCSDCEKNREPQLHVRGRMLSISEVRLQAEELEDQDMLAALEVYDRRN